MATMTLLKLVREILLALCIFTVVFLLFYTMNGISKNRPKREPVTDLDDEFITTLIGSDGTRSIRDETKTLPNKGSQSAKNEKATPTESTEIGDTKKKTQPKSTNGDKNLNMKQSQTTKFDIKRLIQSRTKGYTIQSESPKDNARGNKTRYLIYLCDKFRSCGGWGDRQKGFPAAYVLSVVTGRKFGLNMSYPCDLKMFYVPNEIDWYVKPSEIRGLSWEIVDWMDNKHRNVEVESDFNKRYPSDVVFLRTNQNILGRIKNSRRYGHLFPDELKDLKWSWIILWHRLMKPSIHLQELIERFMSLSKIPSKGDLICAHVRMRKNPTLPNDSPAINSMDKIDNLWQFLSKYEKNASRIFIATDSMEVRESARKQFGEKELDTNGIVLHIDRQGKSSDACIAFEMVHVEQNILAKCNILVLTYSGFGWNAAAISVIPQEHFVFHNGTIRKVP